MMTKVDSADGCFQPTCLGLGVGLLARSLGIQKSQKIFFSPPDKIVCALCSVWRQMTHCRAPTGLHPSWSLKITTSNFPPRFFHGPCFFLEMLFRCIECINVTSNLDPGPFTVQGLLTSQHSMRSNFLFMKYSWSLEKRSCFLTSIIPKIIRAINYMSHLTT